MDDKVLSYFERKAHLDAVKRTIGFKKCRVCDTFICICQVNLLDWVEVRVVLKEPSRRFKIQSCPGKCVNSGLKCLECYDWDKFETRVIL